MKEVYIRWEETTVRGKVFEVEDAFDPDDVGQVFELLADYGEADEISAHDEILVSEEVK